MNSVRELVVIMLVAALATLVLFGIPTAIEIFLHHRRISKNKKLLKNIARTTVKKYGDNFTVPRKEKTK